MSWEITGFYLIFFYLKISVFEQWLVGGERW